MECLRYGLILEAIFHDWTKFLPSEWFAYAEYFYGEYGGRDVAKPPHIQEAFDRAWNHHQKRHDHHYQNYVLLNDNGTVVVLEMPIEKRKAMVADWRGASRANNGGNDFTPDWYDKTKDTKTIAPLTRQWVERELNLQRLAQKEGSWKKMNLRR